MERIFNFNTNGEGSRILKCPNCGAHTSAKEVTYTDEGNVILATDRKGKPTLAYQVANPLSENYGNIIKIKPKSQNNKPFRQRKRKKENTE
jgi:hypothetical protein